MSPPSFVPSRGCRLKSFTKSFPFLFSQGCCRLLPRLHTWQPWHFFLQRWIQTCHSPLNRRGWGLWVVITLELLRWQLSHSLWKLNPVSGPWHQKKARDQEEEGEEMAAVGLLIKGMDYLFSSRWHFVCLPNSCCGLSAALAWPTALHWLYCRHIWSHTQILQLADALAAALTREYFPKNVFFLSGWRSLCGSVMMELTLNVNLPNVRADICTGSCWIWMWSNKIFIPYSKFRVFSKWMEVSLKINNFLCSMYLLFTDLSSALARASHQSVPQCLEWMM